MKILITAAHGFIGRNLTRNLSEYDVTSISRQDVDLLNLNVINKFIKK